MKTAEEILDSHSRLFRDPISVYDRIEKCEIIRAMEEYASEKDKEIERITTQVVEAERKGWNEAIETMFGYVNNTTWKTIKNLKK